MLLTKTPLRVSFFGGGSDLPHYYNQKEGLCVSTAIDSFVYLAVNKCISNHIKVIYSELELVDDLDDLKHSRVRETLRHYSMPSNVEVCTFSDMTHKGSGLGSSSTFTVGMVQAAHYLKYHRLLTPKELAELASYIEIHRCFEPIGKQDQYASAYGGFNSYYFRPDGVEVQPVRMDPSLMYSLQEHLLFFNTGMGRKVNAGQMLQKQVKQANNIDLVSQLVEMARQSLVMLKNGRLNDFGSLLNDAWYYKKKLSGVSNVIIDEMYEAGMKAGALGGKVLGAGGGGYMMFFVSRSRKSHVLEALKEYEQREFNFYREGSTIEYGM
jgi:D-glycero-alpha-D-manno-heptose-7-phosphate kinase